jgi:hypothetical protein
LFEATDLSHYFTDRNQAVVIVDDTLHGKGNVRNIRLLSLFFFLVDRVGCTVLFRVLVSAQHSLVNGAIIIQTVWVPQKTETCAQMYPSSPRQQLGHGWMRLRWRLELPFIPVASVWNVSSSDSSLQVLEQASTLRMNSDSNGDNPSAIMPLFVPPPTEVATQRSSWPPHNQQSTYDWTKPTVQIYQAVFKDEPLPATFSYERRQLDYNYHVRLIRSRLIFQDSVLSQICNATANGGQPQQQPQLDPSSSSSMAHGSFSRLVPWGLARAMYWSN